MCSTPFSYGGHKKVWRQTQRRRITTLRRSFHLDLFTATSDTLSQELRSVYQLPAILRLHMCLIGGGNHTNSPQASSEAPAHDSVWLSGFICEPWITERHFLNNTEGWPMDFKCRQAQQVLYSGELIKIPQGSFTTLSRGSAYAHTQ